MGIFDRARESLDEHADTMGPVVDRAADEADRRTGATHGQQLDRGADLAKHTLGEHGRSDAAAESVQPG